MEKTLIVITGPTASGKSALAIDVAERLDTEIISADSRQIFKRIPIVTAMPSPDELAAVPHHLINMLPLDAYYSAAQFEEDALKIVERIFSAHHTAIVCGGSMMYIDALCNGIDNLPSVPPEIRNSLMEDWRNRGDLWLKSKLLTLDPVYAGKVDPNNLKRIFHAVEISTVAGQPYSSLLTGNKRERPFRILKFMLAPEREQLFNRINDRVIKMVESGLEDEARSVHPLKHLNSLNTVGLKEMFDYFEGKMDFETAVARIQKNTRVYAKKQMTWFKRDNDIIPLDPNTDCADTILSYL